MNEARIHEIDHESIDPTRLREARGGLSYGESCFVGGAFGSAAGALFGAGAPGMVAGAAVGCVVGLAKRAIDGPSK
jgi:hypothetical protein